ncbi:hypothetical protein ACSBR2_022687 [Camellia fascicularis]
MGLQLTYNLGAKPQHRDPSDNQQIKQPQQQVYQASAPTIEKRSSKFRRAYDEEESAARAYDLAALKYCWTSTFTNFPVSAYEKEIKIIQTVTKEGYLPSLRRAVAFQEAYQSTEELRVMNRHIFITDEEADYSKTNVLGTKYRHHHSGRWEARIGRVFRNKYLHLGT